MKCVGCATSIGRLRGSVAEHVDPPQGQGLDGEEVAGDHGLRLAADELKPGKTISLSGRSEPRELAHDPLIALGRVLAREPQDELVNLVSDPREAG
jgi:hypothetical protein